MFFNSWWVDTHCPPGARDLKTFLIYSGVLLAVIALLALVDLVECRDGHPSHILRRLAANAMPGKYVPAEDITFQWAGMSGSGRGPRNADFDFVMVVSSDCVKVTRELYVFASASDADEQFRDWVRSAFKVVVPAGQSVEDKNQRAVLQMERGGGYTILLRDDNSDRVISIHSTSLEHALLFERRRKAIKSEAWPMTAPPTVKMRRTSLETAFNVVAPGRPSLSHGTIVDSLAHAAALACLRIDRNQESVAVGIGELVTLRVGAVFDRVIHLEAAIVLCAEVLYVSQHHA